MRGVAVTGSAAAQGLRGARVIRLGSLFSPYALVLLLYVPILLLYVISSPRAFAEDFDSRKTLSWTGLTYFALALLVFAAGAKLGDDGVRARPPKPLGQGPKGRLTQAQRRRLVSLLEAALILSIGAYVVWFGLGIQRAGGPTNLIDIWRTDPHRIKGEILTTVPGVTTLTQLAVAAIPLAIAFKLLARGSAIRTLVVVVLALAAFRTVLFSERLAFVELLLPLAYLAAAPRKVTVPRVVVYGLALVLAAVTFFAVTELRRTYTYTHDFSAARATTRFFGYYLTSVNNGIAVVDAYPARTPIYSSGEFLWQFPVVGGLRLEHFPVLGTLSFEYSDAFGVDPERFWPRAFAAQGLDYEFNVLTTPGYLAADFGWAGLLAVLLLGVISGRLYRRSQDSAFHRALYGVWLVGLVEFMRIYYFTNTRVFPAYLVFLAAFLVLRRGTSPAVAVSSVASSRQGDLERIPT